MMSKTLLLYPHQLFKEALEENTPKNICLVEHELFFTQYTFHKKKLILHRSSMKAFEKELIQKGKKVTYLDGGKPLTTQKIIENITTSEVVIYDPVDDYVLQEIEKECGKNKITLTVKKSPNFMTDTLILQEYFSGKKTFHMADFYQKQRSQTKILMEKNGKPVGGQYSFDVDNRKKFDGRTPIPQINWIKEDEVIAEAKVYVEKYFSKNYGVLDGKYYPYTRKQASTWLNEFLEKKFRYFGDFQDALVEKQPFMFHSMLSSSINIGLLSPDQVVKKALEYEHKVPINALEGFIRQIIGWREFMRGAYDYRGRYMRMQNQLGNTRKMPQAFWDGTTGIPPVDQAVKQVQTSAYSHHIERLMVLGNFMLLCDIDPSDIYEWFMSFYIDAYDWVMVPNVYGMSQYADGGVVCTKPYISGSAYIRKMSNYKKGSWCDVWDGLYWRFIEKHQNMLEKNYRMRMMVAMLKKMNPEKRKTHMENAEDFLKSLT